VALPICHVPFGDGHDGDSEFFIVDVQFNDATRRWATQQIFLSAHCGTLTGQRCMWYPDPTSTTVTPTGTAQPFSWIDGKVRGAPIIGVAEGKHSNYSTREDCNGGGLDGVLGHPGAVRRLVVTLKTRILGSTGYAVSELGLGGWGLGADMWRGVEDSQAREALREAVDRGITFFDTALAYGNGHSERLMGRVLKDEIHAGRVVVATKIPPLNDTWPGAARTPVAEVFPARHIAASTEKSLKNLGVDALPLQH